MADTDIDFDLLVKAAGPVISFKAGDVIFREGDPALELLVIKSGTVEIRIRNRLIDTLGKRSIFGEMALIDSRPRSATALALTDTELIPLGDKGVQSAGCLQPGVCAKRAARVGEAPARSRCHHAMIDQYAKDGCGQHRTKHDVDRF